MKNNKKGQIDPFFVFILGLYNDSNHINTQKYTSAVVFVYFLLFWV